ncbi:DUF1304 domain-containing protein [Novipirellula caenicola]|uniref:DUF1304 domain-containing protein n=1 Tax=Novipirellula caenicola TaxID=1536901 RepID=A0ABP9VSA3_9BACT
MQTIAELAVGAVAAIQFLIAGIELFLWKNERVYTRLKSLNLSEDEAKKIAPIVANAGLYNAFIGAGLVWGLRSSECETSLKLFFLACVATAGIFGAATLSKNTLFLQTLPALVAGGLTWIAITT